MSVDRRILMAVTANQSLKLMNGFPAFLASRGWEVHVVTGGGNSLGASFYLGDVQNVNIHHLAMQRRPSLRVDLRGLILWIRLVRSLRPGVVLIGTPKASLLGVTAAAACRVPRRIYLLRGLRLEGSVGAERMILLAFEKWISMLSTAVLCVSPSLRDTAIRLGVTTPVKAITLGPGSSNGVSIPPRSELTSRAVLGGQAVVIGYVGRITSDKGLEQLVDAAAVVADTTVVRLLFVGDEDEPGYLRRLKKRASDSDIVIEHRAYVTDVGTAYRDMDIFVLPSRREGMPNVALEAAAHGLPVIVSDSTGCVDAVRPGETGLIYKFGEVSALAESMRALATDRDLRQRLGARGRDWVSSTFSRHIVWQRYLDFLETKTSSSRA